MEQELKKYKEEFDFLHDKIGELEWKRATLFKDRTAVSTSEIDRIDAQLENYTESISIVLKNVKEYIQDSKEKK